MPQIEAAGGVLWRGDPAGPEVALVHRPKYDDWSLPKGKLDPGEHPLLGALREIAEETGFVGPARTTRRVAALRHAGRAQAGAVLGLRSARPERSWPAARSTSCGGGRCRKR